MAEKLNENGKYKAISGRLSDYFGFKSSDDGSVMSGAESAWRTLIAYTSLLVTMLYEVYCLGIIRIQLY